MPVNAAIRIDKWLWSVRLYKTRSLATEACKAGKVKLEGRVIKPSHETRIGEVYLISAGPIQRQIRVKELLQNRISAKLVADYLEDLTSPEEYQKLETLRMVKQGIRPHGYGRPTKKDRRDLQDFQAF
jgi:ribosome-associated heat shock protein Hsp15